MRAGRKALELVVDDTEVSYLANNERQLAIERLLIRFGEASEEHSQPVIDRD